jgi:hypothetical protein
VTEESPAAIADPGSTCKCGRRHLKPAPEWLPEATRHWHEGLSANEIARRVGAAVSIVVHWLPCAGIDPHPGVAPSLECRCGKPKAALAAQCGTCWHEEQRASAHDRTCAHPDCDATVSQKATYCLDHVSQHRVLPDKLCNCGQTFTPKSGAQIRCPACKEEHDRTKGHERHLRGKHPCAEPECDALVSRGARLCERHMGLRNRKAPVAKPADLAQSRPDPSAFPTLEAWLNAVADFCGATVHDLSVWCELNHETLPALCRKPTWIPVRISPMICATLGVTREALGRLRPTPDRRRTWEARKQTVLERYGKDFYQKLGEATAEKTRGKKRDPETVKKMKLKRWGPRGWERKRKKAEYGSKVSRSKPPKTGKWPGSEKSETWSARQLLAAYARRKRLPQYRPLMKELYESGAPVAEITQAVRDAVEERCINTDADGRRKDAALVDDFSVSVSVSEYIVRRELGEMGLMPPLPGAVTEADFAAARQIVESEARKEARKRGGAVLQQRAERRLDGALRQLIEEEKSITESALRRRSGSGQGAVQSYMRRKNLEGTPHEGGMG